MGGAELTKVYAAEFDGCPIDGPNNEIMFS